MSIRYKFDVLEKLKQTGYNTNYMRKNKLLSEGAIQALRDGSPISWASIDKICALLKCQPGDLLEYTEDISESDSSKD